MLICGKYFLFVFVFISVSMLFSLLTWTVKKHNEKMTVCEEYSLEVFLNISISTFRLSYVSNTEGETLRSVLTKQKEEQKAEDLM